VGADSYGSHGRWLPGPYLSAGTSSFADFLAAAAPDLLLRAPEPVGGTAAPDVAGSLARDLPHGTTIVAAACDGGVVMAGDRRATAGNMIMQRDIDKVFRSDEFSAMGIAGVAGVAVELARLFQVELEHYEKIEGHALSLDGKANRLAGLVRGNIGAAMQGLVVVPLFCGYDEDSGAGRIFSYDVAGGHYEEHRFHAIGSGSVFARGSLKKLYRNGMTAEDTVLACMQALYDAADDDAATGGPDVTRRLYPVVAIITADGFERLADDDAGEYARTVIEGRMADPDGPPVSPRPAVTPNGSRGALPSR
jgi:proteasome beta subunit